jgi:hypothetical protein
LSEIGTICLDNTRTRKIVLNIEGLINLCIPDGPKRTQWKRAIIEHYNPAMELLRQKAQFSDADVFRFQKLIDLWTQDWINMYGKDGCTNYIHMLSSGHVSEYLFHWRNLYEHSQQGWEALNALIKTYYFRRTNRGGAGKGGRKSRLTQLARWLSRRVVWATGVSWDRIVDELGGDEKQLLRDAVKWKTVVHEAPCDPKNFALPREQVDETNKDDSDYNVGSQVHETKNDDSDMESQVLETSHSVDYSDDDLEIETDIFMLDRGEMDLEDSDGNDCSDDSDDDVT